MNYSIPSLCVQGEKGSIEGICVLCGEKTTHGHKPSFSSNFTGYSYLTNGNCMCPSCFSFMKDQSFRNFSWVATEGKVSFLKRSEVLSHILSPPDPPFAIYVTKTGKRQGWLKGLKMVNYSRDTFYILTDFVGCVRCVRNEAEEKANLIKQLREKKIGKTVLMTGEFSMYQYRQAVLGGYENLVREVKKRIKNPLWEVLVYVAD